MKRKQIVLRLPEGLVEDIDERAAKFKLSRNQWCEKALQRIVEMPSQTRTETKRF